MVEEVCQERVSNDSWHFHACGRKVKEDGLCGIHLGARKRRQVTDKRWEDEREADNQLVEKAKTVGQRFTELTGEYTGVEYSLYSRRPTGNITISPEALTKLMDMVKK
jgi:hypothetical protein